jgi:hypothetical protein
MDPDGEMAPRGRVLRATKDIGIVTVWCRSFTLSSSCSSYSFMSGPVELRGLLPWTCGNLDEE